MCRLVLTSPWCPRAMKQSKFRTYLECFQRRLRPACASIHFYKSIRYSCETSSLYMWATTWDFQQCGMRDQQRLRPACAYAQSDQSLCYSLEYSMSVELLSEYHLEFLSSKGGYTGLSESAHVKTPHSWRSHVTAHVFNHVLYVNAQWSWSLVFTSLKLCLCDNFSFELLLDVCTSQLMRFEYLSHVRPVYAQRSQHIWADFPETVAYALNTKTHHRPTHDTKRKRHTQQAKR